MLNILVLQTQVPFTRGGAEILCDRLIEELVARGHSVDTIQLPFSAVPKSRLYREMSYWKYLDLDEYAGKKVDLVIGTKFPTYLVNHPNKVIWLVHQHRQAYELFGTRFSDFDSSINDEAIRSTIYKEDRRSLEEAKKIFTISPRVTERLKHYLDINSEILPPPPPLFGKYFSETKGSYILSVGRLCSMKRTDMIIKAMPHVSSSLKLKVVGLADEPGYQDYLDSEVKKHNLADRIEFLGRVNDEQLISLYANCFAVSFSPYDEDFGFVTLEALLSGKPVITTDDAGGVLGFVKDGINGLIVQPNPEAMSAAINKLCDSDDFYQGLVRNCKLEGSLSWDLIINKLTDL